MSLTPVVDTAPLMRTYPLFPPPPVSVSPITTSLIYKLVDYDYKFVAETNKLFQVCTTAQAQQQLMTIPATPAAMQKTDEMAPLELRDLSGK
jgi:hypothetical protein